MECISIMTSLSVDSAHLADLWQQVRSVAEERSKDFGDVALQYHLAEQLGLVGLLDRVAGKRDQGISVGQAMVLAKRIWRGMECV